MNNDPAYFIVGVYVALIAVIVVLGGVALVMAAFS
jgi:hypothetical protein